MLSLRNWYSRHLPNLIALVYIHFPLSYKIITLPAEMQADVYAGMVAAAVEENFNSCVPTGEMEEEEGMCPLEGGGGPGVDGGGPGVDGGGPGVDGGGPGVDGGGPDVDGGGPGADGASLALLSLPLLLLSLTVTYM